MDVVSCHGCRQRDATIAVLEARIAKLESEAARQQQTVLRLADTVRRLTERLAQYEPEVRREANDRTAAIPKPALSFSVDAETKRRQGRKRRRKKRSPGRRATEMEMTSKYTIALFQWPRFGHHV